MKLLYCPKCNDVRKLQYDLTTCKCGVSKGRYLSNGADAEINDQAMVIGFHNVALELAIMEVSHDPLKKPVIDAWMQTPESNPRLSVVDFSPRGETVDTAGLSPASPWE